MRLLEYEAKTLLHHYEIPIPYSEVVAKNSPPSFFPAVLKSQVPIGGRGKHGGIRIVTSEEEAQDTLTSLRTLVIKGYVPSVILAEEKIDIQREHYISLLIDRASASIRLIAHKEGGVEVESHATSDFFNQVITEASLGEWGSKLAEYLGYQREPIVYLITRLYKLFIAQDATLIEVNPLIYTKKNEFICGDCKIELDDAASFRHPDWSFEGTPQNANFVTLAQNGNVATIANGAGLAMATVDSVAARGMTPANFLDIGGGANTESILQAFRRIGEFPNVEAIIINIFAGITRCDEVAKAIIAARKHIPSLPPLFIRLAGTNFEEAARLLETEHIPILATLDACIDAAKEKLS